MKVNVAILSVFLVAPLSVFAADAKKVSSPTVVVNIGNITITNKSDVDIAYRVSGKFPGFVYGVKAGETDLYVFKGSDTYHSGFETAECYKMGATGGACREYGVFQPCMTNDYGGFQRYNFIDLLSASTCDFVHSYNW